MVILSLSLSFPCHVGLIVPSHARLQLVLCESMCARNSDQRVVSNFRPIRDNLILHTSHVVLWMWMEWTVARAEINVKTWLSLIRHFLRPFQSILQCEVLSRGGDGDWGIIFVSWVVLTNAILRMHIMTCGATAKHLL